jgi:hypothetical protein
MIDGRSDSRYGREEFKSPFPLSRKWAGIWGVILGFAATIWLYSQSEVSEPFWFWVIIWIFCVLFLFIMNEYSRLMDWIKDRYPRAYKALMFAIFSCAVLYGLFSVLNEIRSRFG